MVGIWGEARRVGVCESGVQVCKRVVQSGVQASCAVRCASELCSQLCKRVVQSGVQASCAVSCAVTCQESHVKSRVCKCSATTERLV